MTSPPPPEPRCAKINMHSVLLAPSSFLDLDKSLSATAGRLGGRAFPSRRAGFYPGPGASFRNINRVPRLVLLSAEVSRAPDRPARERVAETPGVLATPPAILSVPHTSSTDLAQRPPTRVALLCTVLLSRQTRPRFSQRGVRSISHLVPQANLFAWYVSI